ncbi:hypothetical protein ROHU_034399 [Labeo rohita]|uniref:Uncharacterized protein n=1 Tax=Labeo rohita TaxID=84645 RepID=A0A498LAU1_LABRO|nr:hypothetical protein ROHU_034399 [Labeo rohita]
MLTNGNGSAKKNMMQDYKAASLLAFALSLGIGRPDLAEESMLEWGCAAGGSPLMGTPWEPDAKAAVGSQMWQLSCNS